MNYTSIEQSKKLLELGLSPESADMCYPLYGIAKPEGKYPLLQEKNTEGIPNINIPCWSVGALLEVMPKHPKFNTALRIIEGKDIIWAFECHAISEYEFKGTSDLECLYNAVVWLLENNYIKNQ